MQVHINYLTPKPGFSLLKEMLNNESKYLGIEKTILLGTIRGREMDSPLKTSKIVNKIFKFGPKEKALQHFITAQKTARTAVGSVMKTYGLPSRFGQKTEVYIPDPEISRMLLYTNSGKSKTLPEGAILRTRFEQLRELFLTDIALRLDKRAVNEKSYDKMSKLQLLFNQYLFDGPAGMGNSIPYYISYNEEHGIKRISKQYFEGAIKIEEEMRTIIIDNKKIHVEVDFDKKTAARQIVKGLVDFIKIGADEYDPLGKDPKGKPALQDRQRFRFVVDGNDHDLAFVHDKISTFFSKVIEIPINHDNGQNPTLKKRYIAIYEGIPIEIVYYDVKGYKNSQEHIGKKNSIGLYGGSAHELFEIRRSLPILLYFFPFEAYRKPGQSEEEYYVEMFNFARQKSEEIARRIRGF